MMFGKGCSSVFVLCLMVCSSPVFCRNVENLPATRQKRSVQVWETSCAKVNEKLEFLNATNLRTDAKGNVCGGECCSVQTELLLRKQGQTDFANILRGYSTSLLGTLSTISTILQKYITDIANQSENVTQGIATQIYKGQPKQPISSLYEDIKRYVEINESTEGSPPSSIDIKTSVSHFFETLFPIAYRQAIDSREFNHDYKTCLKKYYNELQPFGDIPRQMGLSLSKSLESTRLLFESLKMGIEVMNASDIFAEDNSRNNGECYDALMKMTYCPKCQGLPSHKPCSGYCLNVLRGCLSPYVAGLDAPWNTYVEGIERLVTSLKQPNNEAGVNAGLVIRGLDSKISDAIMHILKKKEEIESRVKRNCGPPKFSEMETPITIDTSVEVTASSNSSNGKRVASRAVFAPLPTSHINNFLTSISQSKNFYDNLADNLCRDESFAETKDKKCWNGERIGEYTKTVVDASLDTQKYNPEVKLGSTIPNTDSSIAALADKLRHVHQTVISSLGGVNLPEADNYVQQGDDPDQGSGSGYGNGDEDEGEEFSGSGDDRSTTVNDPDRGRGSVNPTDQSGHPAKPIPPTGSVSATQPTTMLVVALLLISSYWLKA